MKDTRSRRAGLAVALLLGLAAPAAAPAQAVSLHAGVRHAGEASTPMAAVRAELPLHEVFLLELAGSVADPPEGAARSDGVLEAQLQLAVPLGDVLTPYVGAGAGIAHLRESPGRGDRVERIISVAAGFRTRLSPRLALVLDARLRGPSTMESDGGETDLTAGVRYQFGRRGNTR
jgi:hypothetical protein